MAEIHFITNRADRLAYTEELALESIERQSDSYRLRFSSPEASLIIIIGKETRNTISTALSFLDTTPSLSQVRT